MKLIDLSFVLSTHIESSKLSSPKEVMDPLYLVVGAVPQHCPHAQGYVKLVAGDSDINILGIQILK